MTALVNRFSTPNWQWVVAIAIALGLAIGAAALLGRGVGIFPLVLGSNLVVLGVLMVATRAQRKIVKSRLERHVRALCDAPVDTSFHAEPFTSELEAVWIPYLRKLQDHVMHCRQQGEDASRQRTEAEVRARHLGRAADQRSELLDSLSEPVLAIDQHDHLTFANTAAVQLLGIPDDPAGQPLESVIERDDLRCILLDTRRRKLSSQKNAELEFTDPSTSETTHYLVSCRSLNHDRRDDGQDGQAGAVAVLSDISAQKAIHKRNAEFVAAVSHEMKTPLAGIRAYVELLADGDADDEATREEFLGIISGQADRLQRLVENMLNLSRIEAGVLNVQKKPQSLNELLEEATELVQPAAEQKQIDFKLELSPMYLGVAADHDLLLQASINLLSNAIKYTGEGGQVTLRSRLDDTDVVFEVADTGVGLSSEDCCRIFDKFYRVAGSQKMASGTGLGLPLAKHIVEDVHNGRLVVQSQLGEGSTFRVHMPQAGSVNH